MKYISSLILVFSVFIAGAQTINNPQFEFTNTGIYHINSIVLSDTATTVEVKINFLPKWWTQFSDKAYLENAETGEKYTVKAIVGAKFNTKLWTPKSGDTSVKLIFPKLDKKVKRLNYGDDGVTYVYGISWKEQSKSKKIASIPKDIQKWLAEKTAPKKLKTTHSDFFLTDSIHIVGYIRGYDKRAPFASGIIYHENNITGEDFPTTVRIYEDGRFECSMLAIHPIVSNILFDKSHFSFYAEPGATTGIILDWNEFLLADRYRDKRYEFEKLEYLGVNKRINEDLAAIKFTRPDYNKLQEYIKKKKPEDFKHAQLRNWEIARQAADAAMLVKQTPITAKKMVTNQIDLTYANYLFDYENSRGYYQKEEPGNEILKLPMPDNYFDFLNKIDLDDRSLLISEEFSTLINRFEFSPVYDRKVLNKGRALDYLKLDSAYLSNNKKTSLVYDIAKLRSLTSSLEFTQYKVTNFAEETTHLSQTTKEPFLINEMNRVYEKYKLGNVAYELPNTAAAKVFKKIIEPLKGKILIVDFWAQWCGPCRSGIEGSLALRKKYKDNPDFDFVFVTDIKSTEAGFYNDYTIKNSMTNTHRISADEYLALRELFKFNGIPRYVLVNAEGKIQNDDFASYNLEDELEKYFPEKFSDDYWK